MVHKTKINKHFKDCKRCKNSFHTHQKKARICLDCYKRPKGYYT